MAGEDIDRIKQATARLSQVGMRLGEAISRAASDSGGGSSARSQAEPGVVDAEFEEVNKRDRKAG
jgi:hypothetical protein